MDNKIFGIKKQLAYAVIDIQTIRNTYLDIHDYPTKTNLHKSFLYSLCNK